MPLSKDTIREAYGSFLKDHPHILECASTNEILHHLFPDTYLQEKQRYLRLAKSRAPFRRHPCKPHHLVDYTLSKRHIFQIWGTIFDHRKYSPQDYPEHELHRRLTQQEKAYQRWQKKRIEAATLLGCPPFPEPKPEYAQVDWGNQNLTTIGKQLGVTRERARQIRCMLRQPKLRPKQERVKEWVKAHAELVPTLTQKELSQICPLRPSVQLIRQVLSQLRLTSKKDTVWANTRINLKLSNQDLLRIYQCAYGTLARRRKKTKVRPEPHHPDYAKWLEEEKNKAAAFNPFTPKKIPECLQTVDWTQSNIAIAKQFGLTSVTVATYRSYLGIPQIRSKKTKLRLQMEAYFHEHPDQLESTSPNQIIPILGIPPEKRSRVEGYLHHIRKQFRKGL